MEFAVVVDCPHCEVELESPAELEKDQGEQDDSTTLLLKATCDNCEKDFWFTAYLVAEDVFKREPEGEA